MDVYILLTGYYHEETPAGVFSMREAAQAALDAAVIAEPDTDPYVETWTVDGSEVDHDIVPSAAALAMRQSARAEAAEAYKKSIEDYVAAGGVVCSTSPVPPPPTVIDMAVKV